jgi:sensor histidine kinase YesM
MLILSASLYYQCRLIIQRKELEYAFNELEILNSHLDKSISQIKNSMTGILMNAEVLSEASDRNMSEIERYLTREKINALLTSASAYAATGQSFAFISENGHSYDNGNPINRFLKYEDAYVQRIVDTWPGWSISARELYKVVSVSAITIGIPVYYRREDIGVLIADIHHASLDAIVGEDRNIFILNEDNDYLYTHGNSGLKDAINLFSLSNGSTIDIDGVEYLCVKTHSTSQLFTTIALIPEKVIFKDSSSFTFQSFIAILIIFCESFIFAWLVGVMISGNIIKVSKSVDAFTDYSVPVKLEIKSRDEIGRLSRGIENMTTRISNLLKEISRREEEKRHLELQALQSQINPHMIYNTLNTITYLAQVQSVANIEEVSSSFVQLLQLVSKIPGQFIPIRRELDYIRCYTNIKKYNLIYPLQVEIQVDVNLYNYRIPKLILQPFVENSIIHGFKDLCREGVISINITQRDAFLRILIGDNGVGMDKKKIADILRPEEQDSDKLCQKVGISNTIKRLMLHYDNNFTFDILSDSETYTIIILEIPMENC